MLMIEGKQMHKSKGNFITMKKAVEQYGADATRCAMLMAAEGMDDPDWRAENVKDIQTKLDSFHNFAKTIIENAKTDENGQLEKWLTSMLQRRIADVTKNLEEMKTRTALEIALFETWNDFRWYIRRKGKADTKMLKETLKTWLKLVAPFAPHICEETWSKMCKNSFISLAEWPKADEKLVDMHIEEQENLLKNVIEDTLNVLRATKIAPRKICYYVASPWKWKLYMKILEKSMQGETKLNELMKEFAANSELKPYMKEIGKLAPRLVNEVSRMPEERKRDVVKIGVLGEKKLIEEAEAFLDERFNAEIAVYSEEDNQRYDPKQRAALSMPYRPAIYIE
jgi:leucyl-tRNA synthetase